MFEDLSLTELLLVRSKKYYVEVFNLTLPVDTDYMITIPQLQRISSDETWELPSPIALRHVILQFI